MTDPKTFIDKMGAIRPEFRTQIEDHASQVECECPTHLLKIMDSINDFQVYETQCLINDINQREIHNWLLEESKTLEAKVSQVIIELMKREKLLDENNDFVKLP